MRASDTLHCGFTGSGPGLEVVLSSRPSGRVCESASLRVCLVVSKWRRRGCANKNTNGNWSGQSSALLIWTRIGAPLAGVNPSLSAPLTPPMQFDPAPSPSGPDCCGAVRVLCALCVCSVHLPVRANPQLSSQVATVRWSLSAGRCPLSRTPGGSQWPQILFQRRDGPAAQHLPSAMRP
jgi:hypothetical protein